MKYIKSYENIYKPEELNDEHFRRLSKYQPDYKEGDLVKFIGPDKPGLDKNEIYVADSITHQDIGNGYEDFYYFTRIKGTIFNLYSAKLRKLTELELNAHKYNI